MNFRDGKEALINGWVDIILIPVVVTSSDADDFHFSIPVAKNWYIRYLSRHLSTRIYLVENSRIAKDV